MSDSLLAGISILSYPEDWVRERAHCGGKYPRVEWERTRVGDEKKPDSDVRPTSERAAGEVAAGLQAGASG